MATTGIWKIEKRLDHVLEYVMNPEKTIKKDINYQEFHRLSEYDILDFNSEEECYVSGLNCNPDTAFQDMMKTKQLYEKENGNLGYHAFQSFAKGEVTASQAHLIGLKLAEELWGDRFEVVVATHINTNHIHNHFVINSVSFKDGKKYHDCRESMALLRETSDSICQEYGLSVLKEDNCKAGKVKYSNYYDGYVKKSNYHTIAKEDIDRAISMAYSYKDFENIMVKMGYVITNRYGKLSIRRNPYKKNIRIVRAFGDDYELESIEKRIEMTKAPRIPFPEAYNPCDSSNQIRNLKTLQKEKTHGLYGLYKYYCYILKVYPIQYPRKYIPPAIRVEVKRMDEISKQTQLLVSKNIQTYEQLIYLKNSLNQDIKILLSKRENLWRKIKRKTSDLEKQTIRIEIDKITKELSSKREYYQLYIGIEKRLNIVKENIKQFEKEIGEEKIKNELK